MQFKYEVKSKLALTHTHTPIHTQHTHSAQTLWKTDSSNTIKNKKHNRTNDQTNSYL